MTWLWARRPEVGRSPVARLTLLTDSVTGLRGPGELAGETRRLQDRARAGEVATLELVIWEGVSDDGG